MLSFNRYICVCYNHVYDKVFSKTKTAIYCLLTWLVAPIANIFIIQLEAYHYDDKNKTCMFNRTFNRLVVSISSACGIMMPCIFLYYFYIRIFVHTIKTRKNAKNHDQLKNKQTENIDLSFSVGLFASLILFTSTFVPFCILLIVDYEDELPRAFHLFGLLFIRINSCLNPVLYYATNSLFRDSMKNFFYFFFNRKNYSFSF